MRELARQGRLAAVAAQAVGEEAVRLRRAAHGLVWPVVFGRLTAHVERRRGHWECARSIHTLAADCLDSFHDDVDAAVDDLLVHGRQSIEALEGWVARRLTRSTIDAHRRRRGQRGALQRPRVPAWLADALDHSPWLVTLAREILVWVGVPTSAGSQLWPLDGWANLRARTMDSAVHHAEDSVALDVERVLAAMRTRVAWYERYVETPLAHKRVPVSLDPAPDGRALLLVDRREAADCWLYQRASLAIAEVVARINAAGTVDAETVVVETVRLAFCDGTSDEIDLPPAQGAGLDEYVAARLADPVSRGRLVAAVLAIMQSVGALGAAALTSQRTPPDRRGPRRHGPPRVPVGRGAPQPRPAG